MNCQNCGTEIEINNRYYRAGKNGTTFCSKECAYDAYEGYYTPEEVEKTLTRHIRSERDAKNRSEVL